MTDGPPNDFIGWAHIQSFSK